MSISGISAVRVVTLIKVVGRAIPSTSTIEPVTKLVPVTVMVNPTSPAKAESGLIEPIVGTGESVPEMVKRREFETPPPGDGLMTVIAAESATQ